MTNQNIKLINVMTNREILNKILEIKNEELDKIDLKHNDIILSKLKTFAYYFHSPSGRDHYRLLSQISKFYDDELLFDVGSNNGCSALALSENTSNKIKSYDINFHDGVQYVIKDNIEFFLKNVLEETDFPNNCRFIMLDTDHDGKFEKIFYDYLVENNYKGLLFLDDIRLNNEMRNFWGNIIKEEKYDLTSIGHNTGSGIVIFE
jgi:hypothetical protein